MKKKNSIKNTHNLQSPYFIKIKGLCLKGQFRIKFISLSLTI